MKVTLLFSKYITDPTGASAVMKYLIEGKSIFNSNGVSISYLTRDDLYPKKKSNVYSSGKTRLYGLKAIVFSFIERYSRTNSICAILHRYIRSGRAAKAIVKKYLSLPSNDDILFLHEIETCYYYLKYRKANSNLKIVLVSHSSGDLYGTTKIDYPCLGKGLFKRYFDKRESLVLSNIDKLGFVSESSMNYFNNKYCDFPIEKLFFSLNGIPDIKVEKRTIKKAQYNICCVATVNERKGQRFIIDAMIRLPKDIINKIQVNIIGDGEIKEELYCLCKEKGIDSNVTFWGSRSDIPQLLAENDIFILPSIDEGLPISIMEAMRQALPIVSTRVGGIPEMIEDGVTGIFIEPNPDGVKSFFLNIDKYDWAEMGKKSRLLFENKFSISKMVKIYSDIFHQLV